MAPLNANYFDQLLTLKKNAREGDEQGRPDYEQTDIAHTKSRKANQS